ncbi:MAG: sigma-70 family RNA polymerase sigma factor [Planctomycetota bacterium]
MNRNPHRPPAPHEQDGAQPDEAGPVTGPRRAMRARFEQEALPHLDSVFNFSFSLTRNRTSAEDLTQETFTRAFRGFRGFRVGSSAKAWLFKICRNLFIDQYRRREKVNVHALVDGADPVVHDRSFDERTFEERGTRGGLEYRELFTDEVRDELADLPEEFRQALLLCDLEGLTYEEITEVMGTPIGTVRSRISRARSLLRERLCGYARDLGYDMSAVEGLTPCAAC